MLRCIMMVLLAPQHHHPLFQIKPVLKNKVKPKIFQPLHLLIFWPNDNQYPVVTRTWPVARFFFQYPTRFSFENHRVVGYPRQGWAPRPAKKGLPRPAMPHKKASLAPRKLAKPAGRGGAKFIWIPWKLDRSQFQFDSYVSKKSLQCIASTNVL